MDSNKQYNSIPNIKNVRTGYWFAFAILNTYVNHIYTLWYFKMHYGDVIMGTIASQITILTIVYSTVYSDADQRKHQSSASLAFVRGIYRRPVNSPLEWPVTWKLFPFDDFIMVSGNCVVISSVFMTTGHGAFWAVTKKAWIQMYVKCAYYFVPSYN